MTEAMRDVSEKSLQMEITNVNWFFLWEFEAALTVFGFWLWRAASKGL
jgi:hypothetical protein